MHIVVDAAPLGERLKTGIPVYTLNLLKCLIKFDRENRYTIYGTLLGAEDLCAEGGNFKIERLPHFVKALPSHWYFWTFWYYTGFPAQLSADKPDVFLSTYPALPFYCPCPKIALVYDLTPLVFPSAFSRQFRAIFRNQLRHAVKCADRIITISNLTKTDIISLLKAKVEKISVVYPGHDDNFRPGASRDELKVVMRKYGIGTEYILFAGTLEPKKNLPRLVEAFASLKKDGKLVHKLVLVGKRAWGDETVFQAVRRNRLEDEVVFTGYVSQEELSLLMNGADVFVFPSLHEGFGLPPLEAMACGTPVITSNASSLPEVVGDAGLLVDPYSVDEIAGAIHKVVSNRELREEMRRRGLGRAKLFSWERAAQETLQIIEDTYHLQHSHR